MKDLVQKKGQKFTHLGSTLTATAFFGKSGIEYDTAKEAIEKNGNNSMICVKNAEFDGVTDIRLSLKFSN